MRYITLSFDDGREDNYRVAAPILKKYGIPATIFCTTGFIDGSWKKKDGGWKSVSTAVTVDQLIEMSQNGWEIGLHGDRHITELEDWETAVRKITEWGLKKGKIPFSIPDSKGVKDTLELIKSSSLKDDISCVRQGRAVNTKNPWYVLLYVLYTKLNIQDAYNIFNKPSVVNREQINPYEIPSVVVKRDDSPEMLLRFIDIMPENSWTVFMLHSILPEDDVLYKADGWTYSERSFEHFVRGLAQLEKAKMIKMIHMDGVREA